MPLTGGGFSFTLAFSRSMTASWLLKRQGKEWRVVEGSKTGRSHGTPGFGAEQVAACCPDSCSCSSDCQRLLCSRCSLVSRWDFTPQRHRLAKAAAGSGLLKCRHSTQWGKATGVKTDLNSQCISHLTKALLYSWRREKESAAVCPGGVMKRQVGLTKVVAVALWTPDLPSHYPLFRGEEGLWLAVFIGSVSCSWKPMKTLQNSGGQFLHFCCFIFCWKKVLGKSSQMRSTDF